MPFYSTNNTDFKDGDQGTYVWTADNSLNRIYLLSTVSVEKLRMHEVRLGLSGQPKRV